MSTELTGRAALPSSLQELEDEAIYILREVVAEFRGRSRVIGGTILEGEAVVGPGTVQTTAEE